MAATVAAVAVVGVVRLASEVPPPRAFADVLLSGVLAAALASVADPADELVRATPTPAWRRTARRVGLLALVAAVAAAGVTAAFGARWSAPHPGTLVALAVAGVAVAALLTRRLGPGIAELAGAVPIVWAVGRVVLAFLD